MTVWQNLIWFIKFEKSCYKVTFQKTEALFDNLHLSYRLQFNKENKKIVFEKKEELFSLFQ